MLGEATAYEVRANHSLRATLVDTWFWDNRRVLLISQQDDGSPLVEDLSGQIALAAGRGPMSGLVGVELDLSQYIETGSISVRESATSGAKRQEAQVNLGAQIALERSRRGIVGSK
ncbi:MAG: hypothetical protein ACO1OD_01060 [Croceibacterium sp.]